MLSLVLVNVSYVFNNVFNRFSCKSQRLYTHHSIWDIWEETFLLSPYSIDIVTILLTMKALKAEHSKSSQSLELFKLAHEIYSKSRELRLG